MKKALKMLSWELGFKKELIASRPRVVAVFSPGSITQSVIGLGISPLIIDSLSEAPPDDEWSSLAISTS